MSLSRFFTVGGLIRLMIIGGFVAMFLVVVQSCTSERNPAVNSSDVGLAQYSKGTLKRLEIRDAPPAQPNMSFAGPDGREMTLSDYKGKVILLNVWATWCAPCIVEMPMLNELQAARGGDEFEVVTVSVDRIAEDAEKFMTDNNLSMLTPWYDKSYALPAKVGARGLPVSIFYNRKGQEIARVPGEVDWTRPEVSALIDKILEKS